jgi:fused signal recognition particle receptor
MEPALPVMPVALAVLVAAVVVGTVVLAKRRRSPFADDPDLAIAPPPSPMPKAEAPPAESVLARLSRGLARTRDRMVDRVDVLFSGRASIDDGLWRELEELLVTSDVGIRASSRLLDAMRRRAAAEGITDPGRLRGILREEVGRVLAERSGTLVQPGVSKAPTVIMVVGVNGAGKTTTIGKLAARHVRLGRKVLIGAGDTFRAAAIEQVVVWAKRAGADIVKHGEGADPAAVAHDAVEAGIARGCDLVICDTAGRLHTKSDLMAELQKVHRVIGKLLPGAPHEILLVVDSTNGQNAIAQAREFAAAVGVTGIALTKLDGTARGGVIVGIADELSLPVKLIGIGEGVDDLRDFDPAAFVAALFDGGESALGRGHSSAEEAALDRDRGISADESAGTNGEGAPR